MQSPLWPDPTPALDSYDLLLINISGGKDSQATLDVLHELAGDMGIQERIVLVHADLGEAEWPGTLDLVREHARHYRSRLEVVRREITDSNGQRRTQELLEQVLARGMWPDRQRRWCTSDWKRGPCLTVMTKLVREIDPVRLGRPVTVLNVFGFREEESPERKNRPRFTTTSGPATAAATWTCGYRFTAGAPRTSGGACGKPAPRCTTPTPSTACPACPASCAHSRPLARS